MNAFTIIDSLRLMRDLIMETFEKEKRAKEDSYQPPKHKLKNAAQAIRFIRANPSRFNAYKRRKNVQGTSRTSMSGIDQ